MLSKKNSILNFFPLIFFVSLFRLSLSVTLPSYIVKIAPNTTSASASYAFTFNKNPANTGNITININFSSIFIISGASSPSGGSYDGIQSFIISNVTFTGNQVNITINDIINPPFSQSITGLITATIIGSIN